MFGNNLEYHMQTKDKLPVQWLNEELKAYCKLEIIEPQTIIYGYKEKTLDITKYINTFYAKIFR